MARIALVTVSGGGNLPPLARIAAELVRRGHEVRVYADSDASASFAGPFTALPELAFWTPAVPRSVARAVAQAVRLVSDRALERRLLAELDVFAPDGVLLDCLLAGCARAAADAGLRTVVLFHTYLDYWTKGLARGPVGMLGRMRGRGPRRSWDTAELRLVLCDEELDPSTHPAGTAWTGSTERGVPVGRQSVPLVVVSLSTMDLPGQAEVYRRIVEALGRLDIHAIVTLGGLDLELPDASPNIEILSRARHEELFPRTSLLIGHGGLSTTFKALAHGIPLVLLPIHPLLDQPMVAQSVANAGAGVTLKRTAPIDEIAAAVRRVLGEPSYAETASGIGRRLRSVDGVSRAADAVAGLLDAAAT